jgi:hypothetical protein
MTFQFHRPRPHGKTPLPPPHPFVIQSEEFALRSKANPQSKDPFQLNPAHRPCGVFSPIPPLAWNTVASLATGKWQPTTAICERTMNSPCGNRIHNPRIKAVIVEDTTCGVSLLTGTICGSNFAFP